MSDDLLFSTVYPKNLYYFTLKDLFILSMYLFFFPEIAKVRASLFQINGVRKDPLVLPEPEGIVTTLTEKVYVPVKEHPDVSFHILLI